MARPILVTGAAGMLGTEIVPALAAAGHEIVPHTRAAAGSLTDFAAAARFVAEHSPSVVVHAAAETNVDLCQDSPDHAYGVNAVATGALAAAAAEAGAIFVYVSSSGIFDGTKDGPYHEFDQTSPLTVYADSKRQGEVLALQANPRTYVLRAGWLFGGSFSFKKNFVAARLREAAGKPSLSSATDKRGCPTYTADFAAFLVELLAKQPPFGIYHVVNSGSASRFDYVSAIMRLGRTGVPVEGVDSSQFPRRAPVPSNEALEMMMARIVGVTVLRPWEEALEAYLQASLPAEGTPA
jgi:dTDP-4-dehydrorhamnose reductase